MVNGKYSSGCGKFKTIVMLPKCSKYIPKLNFPQLRKNPFSKNEIIGFLGTPGASLFNKHINSIRAQKTAGLDLVLDFKYMFFKYFLKF